MNKCINDIGERYYKMKKKLFQQVPYSTQMLELKIVSIEKSLNYMVFWTLSKNDIIPLIVRVVTYFP